MTTERQKYAVRWINDLFSPFQFYIFAPKGFKPFDEDFIEDRLKVHNFLNKWLNYAKSVQYDIIAEKQAMKEQYENWYNK